MIREWVITIISVVIFITFVEMILPNSDNRRYIDVVIGLLIISIILNPIASLMNKDIIIEEGFLRVANILEKKTLSNRLTSVGLNQNKNIILLYKNELKYQMKRKIESQFNTSVREIRLEVEEEKKENFGLINKIFLVLEEKNKSIENESNIENVEIYVNINIAHVEKNNDNNIEKKSILINKMREEIKESLSKFYKIQINNITIILYVPST